MENRPVVFTSDKWIDCKEKIHVTRHIVSEHEKVHTHEFIEIEYVIGGSGYQYVNGKEYYAEKGSILFLNFGDVHAQTSINKMEVVDCILNPGFISSELSYSENAMDILTLSSFKDFSSSIENFSPVIRLAGKDLIEMEILIELIINEYKHKKTGYLTVLGGYINAVLAKIFRSFKESDNINLYNDMNKIAPEVLKYIEENYNRKLTLKELADISFFNPTYFSRVFKECFGKTVTEYINEKRFHAAVKLLKESNHTIESISHSIGYKDKKQIYKLFKEFTGTTPEKYKLQIKK